MGEGCSVCRYPALARVVVTDRDGRKDLKACREHKPHAENVSRYRDARVEVTLFG